jgi:hypothetical protein
MPATKRARNLQPIETTKIYPLPVFEECSGLGRHALREMRRKGLKTIRCGGRVFVRGADFYAHLESVGDNQ